MRSSSSVDRRAFVAGTLALLAGPFVAEAQTGKVYRVGLLGLGSAGSSPACRRQGFDVQLGPAWAI
jgi:hypothetical protein